MSNVPTILKNIYISLQDTLGTIFCEQNIYYIPIGKLDLLKLNKYFYIGIKFRLYRLNILVKNYLTDKPYIPYIIY